LLTNPRRLKFACYTGSLSMALISNFSSLLFLTFHTQYAISYSLLGFLISINFFLQLGIDLIFSFFSHRFNISKTVKAMPVLTFFGFLIYACWPYMFPDSVYTGLLIGTVLFSTSSGLAEVLLSPLIATIPVADPAREMSKFHSVYAWGTVCVVISSSLFLALFGTHKWQVLAHIYLIIPLVSAFLFFTTNIPAMEVPKKTNDVLKRFKRKGLWLCIFSIFFGSIAENTMALWSSTFLERAFNIPKLWGDIFGVALFGLMLGFGRMLYGKIGKHLERTLLAGYIGATACYFVAAISTAPIVGLLCCAMTGFCTSVLWPGCLSIGSERFPNDGVFIFAVMAASGD